MENTIINRDASDKIKGFVLQKWRATELLIDTMLENKYTHVYCAIEQFDDVYQRVIIDNRVIENLEQNKNYSSNLSFSSDEVKKSLVNFFDMWCKNELSLSIQFAFYSNANYAKERKTDITEELGVDLPDKAILELLNDREYEYDCVLEKVITIFKDYYIKTYNCSKKTGNIKTLENLTMPQWVQFFDNIDWKFGQPDEKELKLRIIDKIKQVKYYKDYIYESEKYIFSRINGMFDERLTEGDFLRRLVHIAEVENIFMAMIVGEKKATDSIYKIWDTIPKPNDKRNLKDKILSVCKTYSHKKIVMHITDFTAGQIELNEQPRQQCISSYKYRIFEACKRYLIEYIDKYDQDEDTEFSEEEVRKMFDEMFELSKKHIEDKAQNYDYPFQDDDIIKKIIFILFENCFLSFDSVE